MKLQILLSTYNGERYLREQLDSLLAQSLFQNRDWEIGITVRDDGSSDKTCEILKKYSEKNAALTYYVGENLGVVRSFFELIEGVSDDVDFIALSDQDDVWMEDKMQRAVSELMKYDASVPALYCGMPLLTDENLTPVHSIMYTDSVAPSFGNALVENICTGCTAVFNRSLAAMVKLERPVFTVMHDWWLYLLASAFGQVVFDSEPHMSYRQHTDNTVGVKRNYRSEFVARLRRFRKNRYNISRQVASLQKICQRHELSLASEHSEWIQDILRSREHIGARLHIFANRAIYRQRGMDNFLFKIILLTGTI